MLTNSISVRGLFLPLESRKLIFLYDNFILLKNRNYIYLVFKDVLLLELFFKETSEMAQWLRAHALSEDPAPLSGYSQLLVFPVPGDLV